MKKHLWLVAVLSVCLVGIAYAWKTRQIFQPTQTISVTASAGSTTNRRVDTIALLSDMGQYSRAAFSTKIQITDSGSQQSATAVSDTCRYIFVAIGNGVYSTLDTLLITGLIADSVMTRTKVVEWSDSLGIGRLKGNQLAMIRLLADSSNVAASIGADSVFEYDISYSLYCQE